MNFTYEYLPWRGINASTMRLYDIKTKIAEDGQPVAIGIPWPTGAIQVRQLDQKEFYWANPQTHEPGKAGLFGRDKFAAGSHKYVTITEGALDAASIHQVLKSPAVSVQSAGTAERDCAVDIDYLRSFERVYLAFDADVPGREAVRRVAKLFPYDRVYVVNFDTRKDANEYLQHGEEDLLRNIWWNSRKYLPEIIKSSLSDFRKILEQPRKIGISYPFKKLTDMTYGIRTGETVLLTAKEKVGKTELMHTILHSILKETSDDIGVGAIFLEEPNQRTLHALAGLSLQRPVHLPDCDCPTAEMDAALRALVKGDERLHLYSHFGHDDPDVFLDTIRFLVSARGCRYVLLDHISMVASGLGGSKDERRVLEYFATRLEMMVKELDFALIIVSHVNDFGQTRGSHYLTKVADITINADRDLVALDPVIRSTIILTVPYNRFSGVTGSAGSLVFDRHTYSWKELETDNDNFAMEMTA